MTLPRRTFLQLASSALALPAVSHAAMAQNYPTRAVRWLVGFAAGGFNDIMARLIGQALSERLGQPFVIENRPGAGGNIATEAVVNAAPDGYTLLLIGSSNTINPTLYEKLSFVFLRDIAPIASFIRAPLVMVVNPAFPARTVPEFIAYAKANPGKLNMASGGNGGSPHVTGELFKMMAGIDMQHVPYRGGSGPAQADLLGGRVDAVRQHGIRHRARSRRPTARARRHYNNTLGSPAGHSDHRGFRARLRGKRDRRRRRPQEHAGRYHRQAQSRDQCDPRHARHEGAAGQSRRATPVTGSPEEFRRLLTEEVDKWGKVVKFSGAKPD